MNFYLFTVARTTLGLTFVAQFTSAVVGCRFVVIGCRPPRTIATKMPSIASLFLPIGTSHSEFSTQDSRTRIITPIGGMSRYMLSGRIEVR